MWAVVVSPEMWERRAGKMERNVGAVLVSLELILKRKGGRRAEGRGGVPTGTR